MFPALFFLSNCTYNVHTVGETPESELLYPDANWSAVFESDRIFEWEGEKTVVKGRIIGGVIENEPDLTDEDFWEFMLYDEKLKKLGYENIFIEEEIEDRHFLGLRNKEGHVLLISSMKEYEGDDFRYTFTIFTDDGELLE